jgi:SLIT-ROBO Rho GTPase activating protein
VSGSQVEINNFRESFERGEDPLADVTDASDINSVAGVLKLYLRELREPLFPIIYFEHFMELARECFCVFDLCVELSVFVHTCGATSLSQL